jgi:hypothetical protein
MAATRTRQLDAPSGGEEVRLAEWNELAAVERAQAARAPRPPARWIAGGFALGVAASLAVLLPALLPFSPGYASDDTAAQVIAAAIAAVAAVGTVPFAAALAARATLVREAGSGRPLLLALALCSAGAAAVHWAVARMHFEEYALFGVFFVAVGVAQLGWGLLVLFRPVRPLLLLGAAGNLLVTALWAIDRAWGLPLGPEHWQPDPVGFADSAASTFELLVVVGSLVLLLAPGRLVLLAQSLNGRTQEQLAGRTAALLTLATGVATTLGLLSAVGAASSFLTPST